MKRIVALALCIILTLTLLAGCNEKKNEAIVGTWVPTSASFNGQTIQYTELDTEEHGFKFTFEDDGSCTLILAGVKNEGTYVFNETSVDIMYGGKTEKLSYDNGIITLNLNYNNETTSFMFTRLRDNG